MTSAELIDVQSLNPGSRVDVETKNRHYQIECLGGNAIRISGHPDYCPDPVPGVLQGSANKEGLVGPGLIGRGLYLRFMLKDHLPVTTTQVVSLQVERH